MANNFCKDCIFYKHNPSAVSYTEKHICTHGMYDQITGEKTLSEESCNLFRDHYCRGNLFIRNEAVLLTEDAEDGK